MSGATPPEEIRRLARRPYSFVAFCSFCLAGVCALVCLVVGLGLSTASATERLVLLLFFCLMAIAVTQGLAALREKRLARLILELLRRIDAAPGVPQADSPDPTGSSALPVPSGRGPGGVPTSL